MPAHPVHLMVGGVSDLVHEIVTYACGFRHSVHVAKTEAKLLGPGFDLLESGKLKRNQVVLRCRRWSRRQSKPWRQRSKWL